METYELIVCILAATAFCSLAFCMCGAFISAMRNRKKNDEERSRIHQRDRKMLQQLSEQNYGISGPTSRASTTKKSPASVSVYNRALQQVHTASIDDEQSTQSSNNEKEIEAKVMQISELGSDQSALPFTCENMLKDEHYKKTSQEIVNKKPVLPQTEGNQTDKSTYTEVAFDPSKRSQTSQS